MTTTDDVPDVATATTDLEHAETAAQEAAQAQADIEHAIATGADDVAPDQLIQAAGLSRFTQLRATAARRRLDTARAAERARGLVALTERARAYAVKYGAEGAKSKEAAIAKFEATVAKAARDLHATEQRQLDDFGELRAEAERLGVPAAYELGGRPDVFIDDRQITLPDITIRRDTGTTVTAADQAATIARQAVRDARKEA